MTRPAILLYAKVRVKSKKHNIFIPVVLPLFLLTSIVSFAEDAVWILCKAPIFSSLAQKAGLQPRELLSSIRKLVRELLESTDLSVDIDVGRGNEKAQVVIKTI